MTVENALPSAAVQTRPTKKGQTQQMLGDNTSWLKCAATSIILLHKNDWTVEQLCKMQLSIEKLHFTSR